MVKTIFKKILVPVDGSEESFKALDYAGRMAKSADAGLLILNVLDAEKLGLSHEFADRFAPDYSDHAPTNNVLKRYSFFYTEKMEEIKDEDAYKRAENIVKEAKEKVKKYVNANAEIALGPVAQTIVTVGEKHDCDLIVIGSRGLSGFKRLLMGHITCDVTEKAHCPVLVVR